MGPKLLYQFFVPLFLLIVPVGFYLYFTFHNPSLSRVIDAVSSQPVGVAASAGLLHHQESIPSRPTSRLIVAYTPNATRLVKETFSLVESWKTVMNIRPISPGTINPPSPVNNTVLNETEIFYRGQLNAEGDLVLPWLEDQRSRLDRNKLADVPWITDTPPTGPPLITDMLILSSFTNNDALHKHPDCISITPHNMHKMMDVKGRSERAVEALRQLPENRNKSWADLRAEALIGESKCFFMKIIVEPTENMPVFNIHPAINSVAVLTTPKLKRLFLNYDLILRSDGDCFILPHLHDPRLIPWAMTGHNPNVTDDRRADLEKLGMRNETVIAQRRELLEDDYIIEDEGFLSSSVTTSPPAPPKSEMAFFTGAGGYGGPTPNSILKQYASFLGLRHQGIHSIGSAWYGHPVDMLKVAAVTIKAGEFLLTHDPIINRRRGGEWPTWFQGVTLLYSAELGVNEVVDGSRMFKMINGLDSVSTTNKTIYEYPKFHIHCWHTSMLYSKFRNYPHSIVQDPEGQMEKANWYSLYHGLAGRRIHEFLEEQNANKQKDLAAVATPVVLEGIVPLQSRFFECPVDYPYPYQQGLFCCKTKLTCNNKPLIISSTCCESHAHVSCGRRIVGGCGEFNQTIVPVLDDVRAAVIKDSFREGMAEVVEEFS